MKLHRHLGLLLAAVFIFGANQSQALMCGPDDCIVVGATNDSPFNVGDSGDFTTGVDAVSPTNAGESFAHAWTFTLNEPGRIDGTLTNNNTLPAFNISGLSLELFSTGDLANNIGDTFVVPAAGVNPFVNFAFNNLGAGDYFFKVSGELLASDGQYASQLAVSQVPLPPAIWLFISALLGWASIGRFARRTQPEA